MMRTTIDKTGSFVASHFKISPKGLRKTGWPVSRPAVTISHETGAGAHEVAERLAEIIQESDPGCAQPWTVLDRQLVERALRDHRLPITLARKMPEDRRSYLDDILDELFGLRPPSWVLVPQVAETILHLAEAGHVVLIGHGATIVTAQLPNVFHVRLVASLTTRVRRIAARQGLSSEQAMRLVEKEDRGRRRYIQTNFHARLDDNLLYHLVINTDRLPFEDAASLIAEGARRFFRFS